MKKLLSFISKVLLFIAVFIWSVLSGCSSKKHLVSTTHAQDSTTVMTKRTLDIAVHDSTSMHEVSSISYIDTSVYCISTVEEATEYGPDEKKTLSKKTQTVKYYRNGKGQDINISKNLVSIEGNRLVDTTTVLYKDISNMDQKEECEESKGHYGKHGWTIYHMLCFWAVMLLILVLLWYAKNKSGD